MSKRNEYALLGALLVDPDGIASVTFVLDVEDFAETRARMIYAAMHRLHVAGLPTDFVMVADELERAGELTFVGTGFLIEVIACCPSSLHLPHYLELVARDGAERRGLTHRTPLKGSVRV